MKRLLLAGFFAFVRKPCGDRRGMPRSTVKIGMINSYSGQFADTAAPDGQRDQALRQAARRHRCRQKNRVHSQGHRRHCARRRQAARAGTRRARPRRHHRRLRADAERARRRRRVRGSKEIHGGHERSDLDHHHQIALHRPHVGDDAATQSNSRHLGGQAWDQDRRTRWSPTTAWHRRRDRLPLGFKEAGGEIVGLGSLPVANPDFSAFVQRAKDAIRKRSTSGFPAAHSRPRSARRWPSVASMHPKIKVLGQDALAFESALKSMGDAPLGIITVCGLRLQSRVAAQQGIRQGLQ